MSVNPTDLTALLVAISFAAGLNVYAAVGSLGLLARFHVLTLPPTLGLLTNWYIIGICLALFVVEFFADKIPAFDLVWNALHTFVRIPVAAFLAYHATSNLPLWEQLAATAAGSAIALAAHGGKIAVRAAVTSSPEPFSNSALSLAEDGFVVFLMWFAAKHPYWSTVIVAAALLVIIMLLRWVVRAMRNLFVEAEQVVVGS
ncbi:MAG TPA: DUF4126 domain-containing protein [Terriglobales bacterium]|nr:DUF4126 domain-containing protein [Terriglobales bacterium]